MDEEETKGKEKEETAPGSEQKGTKDTGKGDKSKTPQAIVDANLAAERLEKANTKHSELMDRQEDMIARKILGGMTEAGQPSEKKEETNADYTKNIMAGESNE